MDVSTAQDDTGEWPGWGAAQILAVSALGIVAAAALLAAAVDRLLSSRRQRALAAELDNALAELGAERAQLASVERHAKCLEVFIDRNVLKPDGPEAYSTFVPDGCGYHWPPRGGRPAAAAAAGAGGGGAAAVDKGVQTSPFIPGSDRGGSMHSNVSFQIDNDGDDHQQNGLWIFQRGVLTASPPPVAAVRVQPHEIKTVTLRSRGGSPQEQAGQRRLQQQQQPQHQKQKQQADKQRPLPGSQSQVDRYWDSDAQ